MLTENTLYEDENDSYNYEKGIYATIHFTWNNSAKILTIEDRDGDFPGMLNERTIQVVLVKEGHGSGINICVSPDQIVRYNGNRQIVQF